MTYYSIYNQYPPEKPRLPEMVHRDSIIPKLSGQILDVVVIGNTPVAGHAARIAALQGFRVALLVESCRDRGYPKPYHDRVSFFNRLISSLTGMPPASQIGGVLAVERLFQESALAARQEGAITLNHVDIVLCQHGFGNRVSISWVDSLTGVKHETQAGAVLNCTGARAAHLGRLTPAEFQKRMDMYTCWNLFFHSSSSLQQPVLGKIPDSQDRYILFPYAGGAYLQLCTKSTQSPQQVSTLVCKHFASVLSSKDMGFCLPEVCAAVPRDSNQFFSTRHEWVLSNGTLSLIGGHPQMSADIAQEGLQRLVQLGGAPVTVTEVANRLLPSKSGDYQGFIEEFRKQTANSGIAAEVIERAIGRFGGRVRSIPEMENWSFVIQGRILEGEIRLLIEQEQHCTVSDLLYDGLEAEFDRDHGLALIDDSIRILSQYFPAADYHSQKEQYVEKVMKARSGL